MIATIAPHFARRHYEARLGAKLEPDYAEWLAERGADGAPLAVLGHRRAADGLLFLETYLDAPIEQAVSSALGRSVARAQIVEIGCLAALPTTALIRLWHGAAQRLDGDHDVVAATLTHPLRRLLGQMGVQVVPPCPELETAGLTHGASIGVAGQRCCGVKVRNQTSTSNPSPFTGGRSYLLSG